jgi:hypothetical protein
MSKVAEFAKQAMESMGAAAGLAKDGVAAAIGNETVQNRVMHGASELAQALAQGGSGFTPYGMNNKLPEHDKANEPNHGLGQQQEQERGMSR